jgi:hypothetical protein
LSLQASPTAGKTAGNFCSPFVPSCYFAILELINTLKGERYLGSLLLLRRKSGIFHIYGTYEIIMFMKQESIRTTVDIPAPLYRKLKEQAAGTGSSIRELVLLGVKRVVLQAQRPRPKRVEFPLIVSKGPQVDLTNEQIYEHVEFP